MKTEHPLDHDELEILTAYDAGELASVTGKDEIEKLRAAARATGTNVNIRLSSADVRDIQALAQAHPGATIQRRPLNSQQHGAQFNVR